MYFHKYIGPKNPGAADASPTTPIYNEVKETNIQDLLLLENRDRTYESDIYQIRGVYNVQSVDFNLSQFALFLDNDTVYMTVHINDTVKTIGRKPIVGDVLELPHLRDEFAFNDLDISLPRYYVVSDVGRASEGFSMTWYPHLYRLKLTKLKAQQQFADILNVPADESVNYLGEYDPATNYDVGDVIRYQGVLYTVTTATSGTTPPDLGFYEVYTQPTLENVLTTKGRTLEINNAVLAQAEADSPLSGYDTRHFYTLAVGADGKPSIATINEDVLASSDDHTFDATSILQNPIREGYTGYLLGDGVPPNGAAFGHGISFPASATQGDYFLRTDYMPNRLYSFNGSRWVKIEDNVRHTLTNTSSRQTQKFGFINNTNSDVIGGETVVERQSLSKALRPKADF